jgi:hypothetical protein
VGVALAEAKTTLAAGEANAAEPVGRAHRIWAICANFTRPIKHQ